MREIIMVATVSFLLGGMLMFLMLQQSTPTSSHTNKTCNNNDKVVIDPLSISTATTAADKNDDGNTQPLTMLLSSDSRNELLMGYDLLSNIFTAQSNLWLVPILRKLSPGATPLVSETTDLIQTLVKSGSKHKKELATNILIKNGKGIRYLSPNVAQHYKDPNPPNKMFNAIGKYVAWNIMQDLTSRGDEFDLHFALVHMASFRVVYSVALGLLEFETNNVRRVWLQDVADEYSMLRMKLRDSIMEYIRRGEGWNC